MDDSAEYRHVKHRRYITVALSVSLTTVLCVGYVVADIFDKLPGVLTLQEVEHATARTPGNAIAAATMVGGLDASKTVDAVAAKALISQFETAASDFGGEYAIAIADAAGNVVAEQNLDTPYTPASTMKTLTAYAAAATLDMGRRWRRRPIWSSAKMALRDWCSKATATCCSASANLIRRTSMGVPGWERLRQTRPKRCGSGASLP